MALRRLALVIVVALMLEGFAAPARAAADDEATFARLVNSERTSRGFRSLATRADLVAVARAHSEGMASSGGIFHNGRLASAVSGWSALGENVGMGPAVQALHEAFMASAGHRANVLDRDYTQIGVGVVSRDGMLFVTVVFARRASAQLRAPSHRRHRVHRRTHARVLLRRT